MKVPGWESLIIILSRGVSSFDGKRRLLTPPRYAALPQLAHLIKIWSLIFPVLLFTSPSIANEPENFRDSQNRDSPLHRLHVRHTATKYPSAQPAAARTNTTPPGWAKDELTKFLQDTHQQQYATFHNKKKAAGRLVAIDELFVRVSKNWLNPSSEVEAMLFLRCHAAFRAAAGEAMAGQAVECYRQCRGMLENAAYAVHIRRDPSLVTVWLNRHQDEAGMNASKKAFQHVTVAACVAAANPHAGQRFEELYQHTIDWGGHPNERSVTGNMKIIEEPDRRVMLAIMLHGDGVELDVALKTTARCGMVSLEMLQVLYDAKFEVLGSMPKCSIFGGASSRRVRWKPSHFGEGSPRIVPPAP